MTTPSYDHAMSLAPHSHELRDVPLCEALSLLQKPLHYGGGRGFRFRRNRYCAKKKNRASKWLRACVPSPVPLFVDPPADVN
jgi:hypothetical protein